MRGMPLFAGLLVIGAWTAVRLSILWSAPMANMADRQIAMRSLFRNPIPPAFAETDRRYAAVIHSPKILSLGKKPLFRKRTWSLNPISADKPRPLENVFAFRPVAQKEMLVRRFQDKTQVTNFVRTTPVSGAFLAPNTESRANKFSLYAYSFWRKGAGGSSGAAATAAQYGGSQSGVIATYRLSGAAASGLFAMLRTAITPGKFAEQEMAAGLRWRPSNSVPVTLTAERRVRFNGQDQFALYAAGSADPAPLAGGFSASGYAQAGIIPGRRTDLFFDAGLRADRSVIALAGMDLAAGFGAWAGGQRGAARLDAGPMVRSNFDVGGVKLQVTADWRFKISGNASPGSGPALTISTGF
jgi:hypothetical protein